MKNKIRNIVGIMALGLVTCYAGGNFVHVQAAEPYKVKGTVYTVKKSKGKISDDVNRAILAASKKAAKTGKHYTVRLKKGTYTVPKTIHLYSGVTLDATGSVLKDISSYGNMLMSGDVKRNTSKKTGAGYKAFHDIGIVGGTWKASVKNEATIMRLGHGKKLSVKNVTLDGGGGIHQLETASINGLTVDGCTFKNLKYRSGENKQEALQLDVSCNTSVFPDYVMDAAVTKNVTVKGCTFINVPRGVGTHTLLLGHYFENITITGNTFKNVREEAIIALGYHNFTIEKNKIRDCGAGILAQYFKSSPSSVWTTTHDGSKMVTGEIRHDAKGVISGNSIQLKEKSLADEVCGIKLYGAKLTASAKGGDGKKVLAKDYYISNVTVKDNRIQTSGMGIHLMDAKNCVIADNTIQGTWSNDGKSKNPKGIFLALASTGNKICGNTVEKFYSNGILLQDASSATEINANRLSGIGGTTSIAGIKLTGENTDATEIVQNVIGKGTYGFGCTGDAIIVTGGASAGVIEKNEIDGAGGHDVKVSGGTVKVIHQDDVFAW